MDEVTSAMDEPNERKLYASLQQTLKKSIMISVGHRSTLESMHDVILNLDRRNRESQSS